MDGRTITLRLNGIETNRQSVQKALGYLTTWALTSYNKVLIFNTGNDFNASYTNETTGMNYFIAGIYDTDTDSYSFHS